VIPDEIFAQMVAEEVKNKLSPDQRQTLMKQENWDKWRRALQVLVENLNGQIDDIDADSEADASRYKALGRDGAKLLKTAESAYKSKRNKVERFRFFVQRRLNQVNAMIENGQVIEESPWETADFYRRAIKMHRTMLQEYNMEETEVDKALWATLDNRWEFDNVDAALL